MHALGALDLALWDIRGKVLEPAGARLLGGMVRNYCECYNTAGIIPGVRPGMSIKERARADHRGRLSRLPHGRRRRAGQRDLQYPRAVNKLYDECVQAREGVGKNGDWCVDFHQRFDLSDAIRGCELIKDLAPYFVEDPVRAEAFRRGPADAAAEGQACRSPPAKSGAIAGTSTSSWRTTISTTCAPPCPTSAASPR